MTSNRGVNRMHRITRQFANASFFSNTRRPITTLQPELKDYQQQVHELRKKYAKESSHIKSAAVRQAEERQERRLKSDAHWQQYLERMRSALNHPSVPTGFDSMHKALRAAPALQLRKHPPKTPAERDACIAKHALNSSLIIEQRRKYLELLSEEAENWVTEETLEKRVQQAIDNPKEYNEHFAQVVAREREIKRKLDGVVLSEPITIDDATLQPLNFH